MFTRRRCHFLQKKKILIISVALAAGLGRKGMGTHSRYQQRSPARIPIRADSRSARREGRGKLKVHLYKAVPWARVVSFKTSTGPTLFVLSSEQVTCDASCPTWQGVPQVRSDVYIRSPSHPFRGILARRALSLPLPRVGEGSREGVTVRLTLYPRARVVSSKTNTGPTLSVLLS